MLLLPKSTRNNIIQILKTQIVPTETGYNLIQVIRVLEGLEEQKKEEKLPKSDKKSDEKQK